MIEENAKCLNFCGVISPQRRIFGWAQVTNAVNKHFSHPYSRNYIREVASGYRTNKQLEKVLNALGIIAQIRAIKQGEVQ